MTGAAGRAYTPEQNALVARFLLRHYLPEGYRAQVMVGFPAVAALERAATSAVVESGGDPARRVALMHPRPGEETMREVDVVEFFRRYGHEYCAALLSADPVFDIGAITDSAHAVGCAILWDTSGRADATPEQLASWHVDAAVSVTSESEPFEVV